MPRRTRLWLNGVEMVPAAPMWLDQAPTDGPYVFAAWSPDAIRNMDGELAQRIFHAPTKKELLKLRAEVKANPHLHRKIKSNLLLNIRICLRRV